MEKKVKKVAETKFVCDKLWRFFRCFRNEAESNHTIIDQNSVNSPCVLQFRAKILSSEVSNEQKYIRLG